MNEGDFQVFDGDEFYAEASGERERAWGEAMNYASQCALPRIEEVTRTPAPMGEEPPAPYAEQNAKALQRIADALPIGHHARVIALDALARKDGIQEGILSTDGSTVGRRALFPEGGAPEASHKRGSNDTTGTAGVAPCPSNPLPSQFRAPPGYELVPTAALEWLNGEGEGFERPEGAKGNFWWRSEFNRRRKMLPPHPGHERSATPEEPWYFVASGGDGFMSQLVPESKLEDAYLACLFGDAEDCPADEREDTLACLRDREEWEIDGSTPVVFRARFEDGYINVYRLSPAAVAAAKTRNSAGNTPK